MPTGATIQKAQVIGKLHMVENVYDIDKNKEQTPFVNSATGKIMTDDDYIKIAQQFDIPFDKNACCQNKTSAN